MTPLGAILHFSSVGELGALFRRHFVIEEMGTGDVPGKGVVHRAVCARMRKAPAGS